MARIFNTYGPRMHPNDGRVVSNFIVQALKGEDITIYGDGLQTRAFCYVEDQIAGWLRLMHHTPDDFTGPVNLGNNTEMSIGDLARAVLELTGSSSSVAFRPLPEHDPRRRKPDLALARESLGYQPKVSWHEGLAKTVAYFRDVMGWQQPTAAFAKGS